jgi:cysteinyl-tRNA synthetase
LGTHYRQKINFDLDGLKSGQKSLNNLRQFLNRLSQEKPRPTKQNLKKQISDFRQKFWSSVADDLNIARGLGVLWQLIEFYNRQPALINPQEMEKMILEFDEILGLDLKSALEETKIPEKIRKMAEAREAARQKKEWLAADRIRKEVENLGYLIEDTASGSKILKK